MLVYARCFWNARRAPPHVARLIVVSLVTLGAGAVLWVADQQLCTKLHHLPLGLPNPQLHAWWHVGLSCGAFYANQYFAALKASKQGLGVVVRGSVLVPQLTLTRGD